MHWSEWQDRMIVARSNSSCPSKAQPFLSWIRVSYRNTSKSLYTYPQSPPFPDKCSLPPSILDIRMQHPSIIDSICTSHPHPELCLLEPASSSPLSACCPVQGSLLLLLGCLLTNLPLTLENRSNYGFHCLLTLIICPLFTGQIIHF